MPRDIFNTLLNEHPVVASYGQKLSINFVVFKVFYNPIEVNEPYSKHSYIHH